MTPANVLVIDDDESIRTACVQTLQGAGFRARAVDNGSRAFEKISRESFDVVLLDLKMPGVSGMQVLETLKRDNPVIQVIIITGYASIDSAVEAGRLGVFHFLCKPFAPEALIATVEKAAKAKRYALKDSCVLMALNEQRPPSEMVMGQSKPIRDLMRLIKQVAPMNSSVLLTGETGSGKELAARTLHRLSNRSHRPFVVVDCGSLVETLFESEIFGHVKGAFTGAVDTTEGKFETAHGGTLLRDEIANINTRVQARLLRVVQEQEISKIGSSQIKKVDVRIISATNRNLQEEVERGRFRNDLFYRLNVVQIHIPSLRERREDIPALAGFFLEQLSRDMRKPVSGISPQAMQILEDYQWPGNVRELKNTIERAIVVCQQKMIDPQDILLGHPSPPAAAQPPPPNNSLAQVERNEIIRVLIANNGNRARSAERLGINRKTLREKIAKYGITVD